MNNFFYAISALLLISLVAVGCETEKDRQLERRLAGLDEALMPIREAEEITLFALDPKYRESEPGLLYDWKILGRTNVTADEFRKVGSALEEAIREGEEAGLAANCFDPRHAVRSRSGDHVVDYVICFACSQVDIYLNGKEETGYLISSSAEPVLEGLMR